MRVTFLGSGDAFFGGGRGHSALLVEDGAGKLLLDCGVTVPQALRRRGVPYARLDTVLITHCHGDHFGGLPFLFLGALDERPPRPLTLVGPAGLAERLEALAGALYRDPRGAQWPGGLVQRPIAPGESIEVNGRRIDALRADHGGGTAALGLRIESGGRVLAVSGDTGPRAPLEDLSRGADLFVCECTLAAREGDEPPAEAPGHLSTRDVRERRPLWTARRVVLTHLSAASRREAAGCPDVEIAEDGLVIDL